MTEGRLLNLQAVEKILAYTRNKTKVYPTICLNIEHLYCKALVDREWEDAIRLEEMFIMAKKMNHRLVELQPGNTEKPVPLKSWYDELAARRRSCYNTTP